MAYAVFTYLNMVLITIINSYKQKDYLIYTEVTLFTLNWVDSGQQAVNTARVTGQCTVR